MSDTEQVVTAQPPQSVDPAAEVAAQESEFARLREERAAKRAEAEGAEPVAPAEPVKPEPAVVATAKPEPATADQKLTPTSGSGKDDTQALRAELDKLKLERDAAVARVAPIQSELDRLRQQPVRQQQGQPQRHRQQPAQANSPAKIFESAEIKQLEKDFPELKPILDVSRQYGAAISERTSALPERDQHIESLTGLVEGEIAPRIGNWEESQRRYEHRSRQDVLTKSYSDWTKHYEMNVVDLGVNPETGEKELMPVDKRMSPAFASWVHTPGNEEIAAKRFSDDPEEVAEMWAKFDADTKATAGAGQVPATGAVENRRQRLAESAAPALKPTPVTHPVDPDKMTDEERFAYRRQLRKAGRL